MTSGHERLLRGEAAPAATASLMVRRPAGGPQSATGRAVWYNPGMSKKKKVRVEMRKNRAKPPRGNDITRAYQEDAAKAEDARTTERVRAKGAISRYRTIVQDDTPAADAGTPASAGECVRGRVLRVHGLQSVVEA